MENQTRFRVKKGSGIKILGLIILIVTGCIFFKNSLVSGEKAVASGDLKILKSEVTETAKFYPYKADGVYMEIIAVKASDGTIRTAFNTCQVCFDSGRGFYTQQGDELICNNCGNRFKIDKVEKIKYGCNPIPITKENKLDDGKYITISKAFLVKYKEYFAKWKK
jgi:hypothetical protein